MSGHIFSIQHDGKLVEMDEEAFVDEDVFQELLEKYPNLLAGDQINTSDPRRWLLVKREIGVPDKLTLNCRWALDHLFLDQDAIPTLIEIKRAVDTRIRREVVGQMLDYAANAVAYWSVEQLIAEFEKQCDHDGIEPETRLQDFLGADSGIDEFWTAVKTNLQAGKIRMIFVADIIPVELKRIVEFLNAQTDPAEILAVEIKQYFGEGLRTVVPRLIGQSAEAESRKRTTGESTRKPKLTEDELQTIADERGVGKQYANLVATLKPLFKTVTTTQSNITFSSQSTGYKTVASMITFTPTISTQDKGVRFGIYVDRLAELIGVSSEDVKAALPEIDLGQPNWGGGYKAGFVPPGDNLESLVQLLSQASATQS